MFVGLSLCRYDAVSMETESKSSVPNKTFTMVRREQGVRAILNDIWLQDSVVNKFMSLSRHQNAGQNRDIKIGNRWFENVAQFRYLGTTISNENLIQEELKRRNTVHTLCGQNAEKFSC
jgi:hypothetical protein